MTRALEGTSHRPSPLGEVLEVVGATSDQIYAAMDWLGRGQARTE